MQLPLPPSVNHLYNRRRDGRVYKVKSAQDYCWLVVVIANQQGVKPLIGPDDELAVRVDLYMATPRRLDLDNSAKVILDSLAVAYAFDDMQVMDLHIRKHVEKGAKSRCTVEIEASV